MRAFRLSYIHTIILYYITFGFRTKTIVIGTVMQSYVVIWVETVTFFPGAHGDNNCFFVEINDWN